MTCSLRSKFLCCFPILAGCSVIGAICSLTGISLLAFTLFTLPVQRLFNLKPFYYSQFTFFLTTLSIYYVGLIFAGCQAIFGALKRSHSNMFPLLAALIAHPFMFFSYKFVYFKDQNVDHYIKEVYSATGLVETNGIYIFIIGTIVAAFFSFCIVNGIEEIKKEYGERLIEEPGDKKSTLREFLENYGFLLFIIGMVLVCFVILSAIAGVDMLIDIIEQNDQIRRDNEAMFTSTQNYWYPFTTEDYSKSFTEGYSTTTTEGPTNSPEDYYPKDYYTTEYLIDS